MLVARHVDQNEYHTTTWSITQFEQLTLKILTGLEELKKATPSRKCSNQTNTRVAIAMNNKWANMVTEVARTWKPRAIFVQLKE